MSQNDDLDFGLANIPFGVASRSTENTDPQIVTRLYDQVYFLPELLSHGLLNQLDQTIRDAILQPKLNNLAALGRPSHRKLREALHQTLSSEENATLRACRASKQEVSMHLPVNVGDFSDFSCSIDHVLNAGEAVLGTRSVPPGFTHFPIGYGGRSSSIVISGTDVRRPAGHFRAGESVEFGPSRAIDFELEVACVIGKPTEKDVPVSAQHADDHLFGFVLLNDWSARDIQGLEMNPLGPFNGKSFATTISPWIVTADALEPFKRPVGSRQHKVMKHLTSPGDQAQYSVNLQVEIISDGSATTVCHSRLEWLYWTFRDMVAHQTSNGCSLRSGDLLATGTVSGSEAGTHGCLLEITRGGKQPVMLSRGEQRTYLQDGDAVRLSGTAGEGERGTGVGFGECFGILQPTLVRHV